MFNSIAIWFTGLFDKIKATIQPFLAQVFSASLNLFISKLWELAVEIVGELSAEDLTNAQKRNEAIKRITKASKEKGIEYRDSQVALLVELAVQYWKSVKG